MSRQPKNTLTALVIAALLGAPVQAQQASSQSQTTTAPPVRPTAEGSAVPSAAGLPAPAGAPSLMPAGATLTRVRAARALRCGVDFEEAEYTNADAHGNHSAFDFDLCKAIAVAVLGPGAHYNIVSYRDEEDALKGVAKNDVDVLASASVTFTNTTSLGLRFSRPSLYDSLGFLVDSAGNAHNAADLAGKKVCFLIGSDIEAQLSGFMDRNRIKWSPFPFSEEGEMEAALITHNCDAVSADVTLLAFERIAFRSMAAHFVILPDLIAKDPLAPAVRQDDPQWAEIVDWVVQALIQAEESGVTQANLAQMRSSPDPTVQRLLGTQHGYGQYLGLDDAWAAEVVAAVGNYGELYERTLGSRSLMKLPRGSNTTWTRGGLLYANPIR